MSAEVALRPAQYDRTIEDVTLTVRCAQSFFGAVGQIIVGALFVAATAYQAVWWGWISRPGVTAVFWLSVEALFFAAYAVVATGLNYLATQRVQAMIDPNDPTPGPEGASA